MGPWLDQATSFRHYALKAIQLRHTCMAGVAKLLTCCVMYVMACTCIHPVFSAGTSEGPDEFHSVLLPSHIMCR